MCVCVLNENKKSVILFTIVCSKQQQQNAVDESGVAVIFVLKLVECNHRHFVLHCLISEEF